VSDSFSTMQSWRSRSLAAVLAAIALGIGAPTAAQNSHTLPVTVVATDGVPKSGATVWFEFAPTPDKVAALGASRTTERWLPLWQGDLDDRIAQARTKQRTATTDADGRATFAVPVFRYQHTRDVRVYAKHGDALGLAIVAKDALAAGRPCVIAIVEPSPITVVVHDADGRPADGVDLAAVAEPTDETIDFWRSSLADRFVPLGRTDANGRRTIRHPQLIRWVPGFLAPAGQEPSRFVAIVPRLLGVADLRWTIDVEADADTLQQVVLPPTGSVEVVLESAVHDRVHQLTVGELLPNSVRAFEEAEELTVPAGETAVVTRVGLGAVLHVHGSARRGEFEATALGPATAHERTRIVVPQRPRYPTLAFLRGRVFEADGTPAKFDHVEIEVTRDDGARWSGFGVCHRRDGNFLVRFFAGPVGTSFTGGRLRLFAGGHAHAEATIGAFTFERERGQVLDTVQAELLPVLVDGVVTLDGVPAADAVIRVVATDGTTPSPTLASARTDAAGRFVARGRSDAAQFAIHASVGRHATSAPVAFAAGARDVTVALTR
jgi:hypothetical protein